MRSLLAFVGLSLAFSIACSATRSASSPAAPGNTDTPQPETAAPQTTATVGAQPGQEQAACVLKLSDAPVFKGLKLGMTVDEVLALFPGSKDDRELSSQLSRPPTQFGSSSFVIRPARFQNKADFAGIAHITVSLLDGRVSRFHIGHDGPEWPHVDQFIAEFLKDRDLPPAEKWKAFPGMDTQLKMLTCAGFEVRVFAGGPGGNLNYVLIQDLEADKKLRDRSRGT